MSAAAAAHSPEQNSCVKVAFCFQRCSKCNRDIGGFEAHALPENPPVFVFHADCCPKCSEARHQSEAEAYFKRLGVIAS